MQSFVEFIGERLLRYTAAKIAAGNTAAFAVTNRPSAGAPPELTMLAACGGAFEPGADNRNFVEEIMRRFALRAAAEKRELVEVAHPDYPDRFCVAQPVCDPEGIRAVLTYTVKCASADEVWGRLRMPYST
jgi:hypothetical protein